MTSHLNQSVPLNRLQHRTVWAVYHGEPIVRACINKILHAIFSGGLSLNTPGSGPAPTAEFEAHLSNVWVPFATNIVVHFVLFGYCPYIINKKRARNRRVVRYPVTLPFGTYEVHNEVTTDYETKWTVYQRAYSAKPMQLNMPDARVRIGFYENGTRPTMEGDLNTDLAALVDTIATIDEMNEYALRAEAIRTHPTLFVESTPDSRRFEEVSHVRAFDGNDIEEATTERQQYNTYSKYKSVQTSQSNASCVAGDLGGVSTRTGRRFANHARIWENNVFCVPDGTQLSSNVPSAEPRGDLLALTEHKEDIICAALGVPKNLMIAGSRGGGAEASQAGSQNKATTFRRTVDSYKTALLGVLNDVYREIYKSDQDVLSLPGAPLIEPELVLTAYDRGCINGDVMQRYMMRAMNASQNDADLDRMSKFDAHHVKCMMENELLADPAAGVPKPEPAAGAGPPTKKKKK